MGVCQKYQLLPSNLLKIISPLKMLFLKFATKHLWNVGISLILSACSYIVMANCRFQAALPIVMIAKKSKLREFFAISTDSRNTWEGWSWAGGEDRWISVVSVAILYFHNLFRRGARGENRWNGSVVTVFFIVLNLLFCISIICSEVRWGAKTGEKVLLLLLLFFLPLQSGTTNFLTSAFKALNLSVNRLVKTSGKCCMLPWKTAFTYNEEQEGSRNKRQCLFVYQLGMYLLLAET